MSKKVLCSKCKVKKNVSGRIKILVYDIAHTSTILPIEISRFVPGFA